MSRPVSVQEAHSAEVERLRRIRMCAPMMVRVELDEPEAAFLADLCDLDATQRNDPKIIGAALKTWLKFDLEEVEYD